MTCTPDSKKWNSAANQHRPQPWRLPGMKHLSFTVSTGHCLSHLVTDTLFNTP
jgi:hypothetical protein